MEYPWGKACLWQVHVWEINQQQNKEKPKSQPNNYQVVKVYKCSNNPYLTRLQCPWSTYFPRLFKLW